MIVLSSGNPKIVKSDKSGLGYLTKIMHLAPATLSGYNTCPWSSPGCRAACLNRSGHGYCTPVQETRIKKTKMLFQNPAKFRELLYAELHKFCRKCNKLGVKPAVRLNGTSDIAWENNVYFSDMFAGFPQIQFYDYTKSFMRALCQEKFDNYHLIYSRSEKVGDDKNCLTLLRAGVNVAVVFRDKLPKKWHRFQVFDGDKTDLRFLDPFGVCGLKVKGVGKKDTSGFVVEVS